MFLTSANLASSLISHGFFTRQGGVSDGIYASLNCAWGSADDTKNIAENRRRVAQTIGATPEKLCSLYQIHGAEVITVTTPWGRESMPKADAMVTGQPGIALGVLAADCVPVLFADVKNKIIGAAHSGWRGALAGVLHNTVQAMQTLGAETNHIAAAIGPAIGWQSYEVSAEFSRIFLQKNSANVDYFIPSPRADHYRFNIKGFVKDSLSQAGIGNINMLENDTYIEEDAFFSYRRATHRGESDYGRQISAIMLNPVT